MDVPGLNELVAVPPPAIYYAPRDQVHLDPPLMDLEPSLETPALETPAVEPPPSKPPALYSASPQAVDSPRDQQVTLPEGNLQVPPPAIYYAPRDQVRLDPPLMDLEPSLETPAVEPPPSKPPALYSASPQAVDSPRDQQITPPEGNLQVSNIGQPGGLTAGRTTQVQLGSAWSYGQLGRPPPRQIPICAFCGGTLRDKYTTVGILLAIMCFPFGLICCMKLRELRCTVCGR